MIYISTRYDGKTKTCTSTGKGYDGATYTLTITVETVQFDAYKEAWNTDYEIGSMTGVQYLLSKANGKDITNYTDGDTKEMYTFEHPATEQTDTLTDYRYIGDSPSNYVYFNCDNDGTNCETWRIVGVFNVEDKNGKMEQRIKLVRGELLNKDMEWDSNGVNEWSTASLNIFLNGEYYYNNFVDVNNEYLKESARNMISEAKYYLGGFESINSEVYYGNTEDIYTLERGTKLYTEDSVIRTTEWFGNIGLLYPSGAAV